MASELVVLQRVDLYERVWSEPIMTIAPRFGISGVYLARICRSMGIPVPGRGYWARVRAGRTPKRRKLPAPKPNEPNELRLQLHDDDRGKFGEEVKAALAAEKDPDWKVTVPERLVRPHELVRDSEPLLRRAAKDGGALAQDRACLDVDTSSAVLQRALRIIDALLKALAKRGYPVEITRPDNRRNEYDRRPVGNRTGAHVNGTFMEFGLEEDHDRIEVMDPKTGRSFVSSWDGRPQPQYKHRPNGKLILRLKTTSFDHGARQMWRDGKSQRVEDCLNDFLRELVATAERIRIHREEIARRDREWAEAEARERREKQLREDLTRRLDMWDCAKRVREFAAVVNSLAGEGGDASSPKPTVERWLRWVERYAAALEEGAVKGVGGRLSE